MVKSCSTGSAYEYLVNIIGGIILLGTPHRGSKTQKWGAILAQLVSLIEYGDTVLMEDVNENSMKIFDLCDQFMKIMIRTGLARKSAVMCFYENLPTDYVRRVVSLGGWFSEQTSSMVILWSWSGHVQND